MEIKVVHISVPLCLLLAILAFLLGLYLGDMRVREEARRAGAVTRVFDQDRWILRWNTGSNSNSPVIAQRQPIKAPTSPLQPLTSTLPPTDDIKMPFQD